MPSAVTLTTFVATMLLQMVHGVDIGCDGGDPVTALLDLATNGRDLLAKPKWNPCHPEWNRVLRGNSLALHKDVESSRHCCVACKSVGTCTAWTYDRNNGNCRTFTPGSYTREVKQNSSSGVLRWRLR